MEVHSLNQHNGEYYLFNYHAIHFYQSYGIQFLLFSLFIHAKEDHIINGVQRFDGLTNENSTGHRIL